MCKQTWILTVRQSLSTRKTDHPQWYTFRIHTRTRTYTVNKRLDEWVDEDLVDLTTLAGPEPKRGANRNLLKRDTAAMHAEAKAPAKAAMAQMMPTKKVSQLSSPARGLNSACFLNTMLDIPPHRFSGTRIVDVPRTCVIPLNSSVAYPWILRVPSKHSLYARN